MPLKSFNLPPAYKKPEKKPKILVILSVLLGECLKLLLAYAIESNEVAKGECYHSKNMKGNYLD